MKRLRVALFGSTGSIGRSTLSVIRAQPDRFELAALACRRSARAIAAQARRFKPGRVILFDRDAARVARDIIGPEVAWGLDPLIETAARADVLVMAMSGTAGILPVLAALEKGRRVCLATKEILVGFGEHVVRAARRYGGLLLPIDSELAAIHQCIGAVPRREIRRVILTASGGPFRASGPPRDATIDEVLAHPTWKMGRKITVDSATLMNKGLELIETARLFALRPDQVEAVMHPASIVHGLVEFADGTMLAQMSRPDMRLPIQYCLTWPERTPSLVRPLDLGRIRRLEFERIDPARFPCFRLARRALALGTAATCALNAANETAVHAFLGRRVALGDIARIVSRTIAALALHKPKPALPSVKSLLAIEERAAACAQELVRARAPRAARRKERKQK